MQKTKTILLFLLISIIICATAAWGVEYASMNELRERGIEKDASYACGYTNGYDDAEDMKASTPLSILTKYKRVSDQDPDYFCAELAYYYKGSYTSGYKAGYSDQRNRNDRAISSDYLNEYDIIKSGSVQTESKTTTYNKWNLDEIDTEQGIENLAYEVGYTDASKGNAKAPLKMMYDLAKDESREVRDVYEWIRENRGTFIKKYKEGYDAYNNEEETSEESDDKETKAIHRQSSTLPSQQSGAEQKEEAYDTGYTFGYEDAIAGEASNPQTVLNYDWVLNARYSGEHSSRSWYKLPEGVSKSDVQKAVADERSYLKGYRAGYEIGTKEKNGLDTEDLTDAEYIYQIGYSVGLEDAENEEQSNPYTYTWKSKRYVTTPEDIDYAKLIRYNRGEYIKGYKDGYEAGEEE